jgi:DNA-binding IclR family transcriptional regulator
MTDEPDGPDTDAADPKFVTALARGLGLLSCFRKNEVELSNHAFVERTGLPKATVTRMTYTLCKLGYLVQSEPGGLYRLGPGVLRLGFGALASTELKDRAEVELRDLCAGDNPNVAAAIAERHDLSAVYLVTHRAPSAILTAFYLGAQVPLFSTSIGRALLMGLSENKREELLGRAFDRAASGEERARLTHGLARATGRLRGLRLLHLVQRMAQGNQRNCSPHRAGRGRPCLRAQCRRSGLPEQCRGIDGNPRAASAARSPQPEPEADGQ